MRWAGTWVVLLLACAALLTLVDSVLLELRYHYFTGGFLAERYLRDTVAALGFAPTSLLLDATAVLAVWVWLVPLSRRIGLTSLQTWLLAGAAGVAGPLLYDYVRFELQRHLGDLADLRLLLTVAGQWPLELLAQGSSHLVPIVATVAGVCVLLWLVLRTVRRVDSGAAFAPPSGRTLLASLTLVGGLSFAVLPSVCLGSRDVCRGLRIKPSGFALGAVVDRVTDVDQDGAGLLAEPPDPAPFDAEIHAFAVDWPANGIDENGLAGDHPAGWPTLPEASDEAPRWPERPPVLIVFLESFRADLLERQVDGQEITPFLNQLANQGVRFSHAYANTPYTNQARGQLFGGRIHPYPGQATLVDDFAANGYQVAYFSSQNVSFGDSEALVGFDRAHVTYDARQDRDDRYTRFSTAGSLAVSWKLLNERLRAFLSERDDPRPLFLYVNYHDTHFPYWHDGLDPLLGVDPLPRHRIRPEEREGVWRTYAQAAANVDRAIAELVTAWRTHIGDTPHVVLVTADHGQSLYEEGFLGHGQALDDAQARVPLVISGLGGDWPEPLGLADLRGLIQQNLASHGPGVPRIVQPPGRRIFLYTALLERPRVIALRGLDGGVSYRLRSEQLSPLGGELAPVDRPFEELIWTWEAQRLLSRARRKGP